MVNALVIRPNTQLAKAQKALRAAQYVRMSTDRQRYSIENQAAVIAAFAQMHNLSIVRTYRDEGESGLKLKNRTGLVQLLDDVQSGRADFSQILVYDVSRWGRFQDTDESAHYEFICKRAGVKVSYCAEMFDNDGSLISSIVKNLKRVMAAEYSRELSVKVHAGQCRLASLGFKQGGPAVYALCRELVDPGMQSKGLLTRGERKYLHTDRVRLRPGPPHEAATLNWIFQQYVTGHKSAAEIARQLNQKAIPAPYAQSWNSRLLCRLLRNENYIGNLVFNRMSRHLGQNAVSNPRDHWIRSVGAIEPMVDQKLFLRAQTILDARRVDLSEEEMLVRLRATLKKHGRLSTAIINETVGLPSTATFMAHFGSIRNAYRLIGYISKRDCDWIDSERLWSQEVARLVSKVADAFASAGRQISIDSTGNSLSTSDGVSISFRIARCGSGKDAKPFTSLERLSREASIERLGNCSQVGGNQQDHPRLFAVADQLPCRTHDKIYRQGAKPTQCTPFRFHLHAGAIAHPADNHGNPCCFIQATTTETIAHTKAAQNQGRPRAALTDRR